jgi:hypothetical protein
MARPTNAERAAIAERRARVLAMRIEQRPYAEIAAALGISEAVAAKDYERAVEARGAELDAQRDVAVQIEVAKLDALERECWRVLRAPHIVVQQGRVVCDADGKPLADDAPVLQAVDRLERIAARRARLRGYDAPTKVEVDDARRAEIEKYAAELAAWVAGVEQGRAADDPGSPAAGEGGADPEGPGGVG